MQIHLSKKYLLDNDKFSDFDFLVYTGLKLIMGPDSKNYPNDKQFYYVSLNQLIIELFGSLAVSRRIRTEIKKSLLNLCKYDESGFIKIQGKLDEVNNEFILDLSNIRIRDNLFVLITDTDIHKILNIRFNGFKETIFRYYCAILSTVNNYNNTFVGNMPLRYIRDLVNTINTEATQLKYNKLLEEAKVLYIHHNGYLVHNGNSVKALPNFYGRYEDKDKIDAIAKQKYNSIDFPIDRSHIDTNEIRSARQIINAIKKGKKYPETKILATKKIVEKENQRLLNMMTSTDDDMLKYNLSKRLINMSIFDDNCILKPIE